MILVGFLLLTVAMAGPTAEARQPRNAEARQPRNRATVMLAIDVSLSMEATDVTPNRLAAAQEAATQFVKDLTPGDQPGHRVLRGGSRPCLSPRRRTVRPPPRPSRVSSSTSAPRPAKRSSPACKPSPPSSKILATAVGTTGPAPARIVMMTDGKRTVGRTEQDAAQQAADAKVPVSMIAFGTDHGSIAYQGSQIPVPLDTQSMQQIAAISGGDFHTASTAEELKSVYSQLSDRIGYETTQQDVSRPWLIAGAMLAIIGSAAALAVSARIP